MGGHGGLNILPQKRWNVYNYENREKVRRDEEQAAREEQLKRDQARKRDAEFRLERLRAAKGLAPLVKPQNEDEEEGDENEKKKKKPRREPEPENSGDPGHINLFEGIKIFDPVRVPEKDGGGGREEGWKKQQKKMMMMKKKEEDGVVVGPEDEKYRLGYGVAGKGVKLPWYLQKPSDNGDVDDERGEEGEMKKKKKSGRKTVEELREERLNRERKEKERERVLMQEKRRSDRDAYGSRRFSRR